MNSNLKYCRYFFVSYDFSPSYYKMNIFPRMIEANTNTTIKHCSKHVNVDASSYCRKCEKYMCTKCKNFHDDFFDKSHENFILPSGDAGDICPHNDKCDVHPKYPLDTICNDCICINNHF